MPSGGIHLCVAKKVASKLNIEDSMNFFIGSVAPDSWRNSSSTKIDTHFITYDTSFDYDYASFYKKYKSQLNYDFLLGYLAHLITDKYWYGNNFISTKMFNSERSELSKACSNLISRYHISRLELPSNFVNPIEELESSGIRMTIDYLNSVNYLEDKDSTFDIDELMVCIDKTSDFVVSELIRLKKDAEN